jgi:uncharacterized damage-inducible protein DinB
VLASCERLVRDYGRVIDLIRGWSMFSAIDSFLPSWHHSRQLTHDFIAAVPEHRWVWLPHPRYGALNKQFRHVLCVQGVYVEGLRNRTAQFSNKHSHYNGRLDGDALVEGLKQMDESMVAALDAIRRSGEDDYTIEFYGTQRLGSYLNAFLHHEALHHGQWSFYATLGGFDTPPSWKLNWEL